MADVKQVIKLHLEGGKANPASVGTVLGPTGINMGEFCQKFNEETKERNEIVPVVLTVFDDRSYEYFTKVTPASSVIKQVAGLEKGSSVPNKEKVATITQAQLKEAAEKKMPDLNANDLESAMKIMAGTARSMGVVVEGAENNEETN